MTWGSVEMRFSRETRCELYSPLRSTRNNVRLVTKRDAILYTLTLTERAVNISRLGLIIYRLTLKVINVNKKGCVEWFAKMMLRRFKFLLKYVFRASATED